MESADSDDSGSPTISTKGVGKGGKASTPLSASSVNAERFIPRHKQIQWDNSPSLIFAASPSRRINKKLTPLDWWVYNPEKRRNPFDICTFNLFHFVPDKMQTMATAMIQGNASFFYPKDLQSPGLNLMLQSFYTLGRETQLKIKNQEVKMTSFADLAPNLREPSIDAIRFHYRTFENQFSENKVIQTTPETLAKMCDEIHRNLEGRSGVSCGIESILEMRGCLAMICRDYLSKSKMLMDVERLQAYEDLKAYDMYSCRFECVEIPQPQIKKMVCPGCMSLSQGKMKLTKKKMKKIEYCGYHMNLTFDRNYRDINSFPILERTQGKNKPSIVKSKYQFRWLTHMLDKDSTKQIGQKKIIAYLHVPGIAENRPLVSIGDLLRFRFGEKEVIGEVGEVQVKTETILIFLPLPDHVTEYTEYVSALCYPKNSPEPPNNLCGRFDVRFGLFSSRAHDVYDVTAASALSRSLDQVLRVITPTLMLDNIRKKSMRRPQMGIAEWVNNLNAEQKHAVFDIVRKNHGQAPYIIYGPPGTGKTMTVVESIVQILRHDISSKILVCAPSDAACDVIAKRLLPVLRDTKIIRVNWWSRNPASLPPVLLPCSRMDESGFFVLPSQAEMEEASIIICQCFVAGCLDVGCSTSKTWMADHFTHTFIDESSQSYEFESLIPLLKVGKACSIVLAGDPKQLGPTVRSNCASRNGLSLSLQERLMGLPLYQLNADYCVFTKLLDNYRSHNALLRVPSDLFYTGSLRCKAPAERTSVCGNFELLANGKFPMMAYDVYDGKEKNKIDTPSFYNLQECDAVVKIIQALLASPNVQINVGEIAVITCFRAQVLKLRSILRENGLPSVNVGVVEDFQGQETSVVLISTVLTQDQTRWRKGAKGGLGFMTDPKRFNVAITRASALCVVVGHVEYLENSGSYWTALIGHIRRNGGISGESRFITNHSDDENGEDDYGIEEFIQKVEELNLLGSGHETDRYDLAMRGYFNDAPEWKVCL